MAAAWCELEESLLLAGSLPVGGLILGSMSPRLIPVALKQNFPIILLEGFGRIPINDEAEKALLNNIQSEISLNAVKRDHYAGIRPEISISLPEDAPMEKYAVEFQTGQKVKIHTSQFAGKIGTITAQNVKPIELPNGIRTVTASILLQSNENVMLPVSNFDIIEAES